MSHWRLRSLEVIDAVIERVGKSDLKKLEKEIRAAYPFGARENHPYKVWREVVRERLYRLQCEAYGGTKDGLFAKKEGES